jgi:hypothetical protein
MLLAMLFPAPPAPAFPSDQTTTTEHYLRYEDCTQDGRLTAIALPQSLATLWQTVDVEHPGARNSIATGVLPILTRLTVTSYDQPIRMDRPVESVAGFELAHDRDAAGSVSRLFMNVWADVRGLAGLAGTPTPPSDGTRELAGRAFAEHTFTRLFASPDQRRVTSLAGIAGYPELPPMRYLQPAPASAAEAPDGATWQGELAADTVDTMFTLDQSDANQHVNSLVYIRCFLDAFQRRLAAGSFPAAVRSKAVDIAYRKPCFVGDRVRAHIRLFTHGDHIGGAGFLAAAGQGEAARPYCYLRVLFGP